MNKFPYIAESNQSKVPWLIYSESLAICLGNELHSYKKINNYDLVEFFSKNITAEYLRNTKVKIESEDHEVFVREIASSANLKCAVLNGFALIFYNFIEDADKLITIPLPLPLPPKDKSMESQMSNFNVETPMPKVKPPKEAAMSKVQINVNNNTDSVVQVTKSDDESNIFIHVNDLPKSEEWPAVGDEVLTVDNEKAIIKALDCDVAWLKFESGEYQTLLIEILKKPPTPEQHLRDKLIAAMDNSSTAFTYAEYIAKAIISGEIKGLEYKPQ